MRYRVEQVAEVEGRDYSGFPWMVQQALDSPFLPVGEPVWVGLCLAASEVDANQIAEALNEAYALRAASGKATLGWQLAEADLARYREALAVIASGGEATMTADVAMGIARAALNSQTPTEVK